MRRLKASPALLRRKPSCSPFCSRREVQYLACREGNRPLAVKFKVGGLISGGLHLHRQSHAGHLEQRCV